MEDVEFPEFPINHPEGAIAGLWNMTSQEWIDWYYTQNELQDAIDSLARSGFTHLAIISDADIDIEPSGF